MKEFFVPGISISIELFLRRTLVPGARIEQ